MQYTETEKATQSYADENSIRIIQASVESKKWAFAVNESMTYLARNLGKMAVSQNDSHKAMEVKETASLASQTFSRISEIDPSELWSDDLRIAEEMKQVVKKLSKYPSRSIILLGGKKTQGL